MPNMEVYWGMGEEGGVGAAQGWCPNLVQGPYGVCLWKSIRKGWDVFCGCVSFKV